MSEFFVKLFENFVGLLAPMRGFDWIVFSINILVFLFARRITSFFHFKDQAVFQKRLRTLRGTNLVLFLLYTVPVVMQAISSEEEVDPSSVGRRISETTLVLLFSFLVRHISRMFTLKKYGREKEIEGETVLSDTYQSEMFSLLIWVLLVSATILALINIWGITDWLKTTSVIGGLVLIAFSTKDVWAPDNVNGLILLYNEQVEPGTVVRVDELDLLAVVNQTTLTQTVFRDLRQRHLILVPNSRFRNSKIEVLSNATSKGLVDYVDFKIGYGFSSEEIEKFLTAVWNQACASESAIDNTGRCRICIYDNGDHAVTWRLYFHVRKVYKLLSARFAVNRAAYDLSLELGIGLNTPQTHELLTTPAPEPGPQFADLAEAEENNKAAQVAEPALKQATDPPAKGEKTAHGQEEEKSKD